MAHLEGQFDVARVLEFEQLHCLVVNASIWVIFLYTWRENGSMMREGIDTVERFSHLIFFLMEGVR